MNGSWIVFRSTGAPGPGLEVSVDAWHFPLIGETVSMEPAEELYADRWPIENRRLPNRRARWRVLPTAAWSGRTAYPRRLGEPAFQRSNPTIRTQARRTMCRSAADVLSTSPKSPIASASDRDIGRGRHTRSTGDLTRRRRGRENSPSRPTIWGMTVFDRPTISVQFFGRFHAHGFPNKWKMPSIYRSF